MNFTPCPSPNFKPRECAIEYIILHGTWMKDTGDALKRLCDEAAEVSCHYLIDKSGEAYQLVADENIAWHAGASAWGSCVGLNKNSIGIELANDGDGTPYTAEQYSVLVELLKILIHKHNIPLEHVLAHSDIAVKRKDDPGAHFNWHVLFHAGVAAPLVKNTSAFVTAEDLRKQGYVHESDAEILKAYALRGENS